MNTYTNASKLVLFEGFNERDAFEIKHKGWFTTNVKLADERCYSVTFYDSGRLIQEITDEIERGSPCFSEPGLIIIPEITIEAMEIAIEYLSTTGYFDQLMPLPK